MLPPALARLSSADKEGIGVEAAHLGFLGTRTGCPIPLGFAHPHPGGIPDNSPTFERWAILSCSSGTTAWDGFVGILWGQILAASDRRSAPRSDLKSPKKRGSPFPASLRLANCDSRLWERHRWRAQRRHAGERGDDAIEARAGAIGDRRRVIERNAGRRIGASGGTGALHIEEASGTARQRGLYP